MELLLDLISKLKFFILNATAHVLAAAGQASTNYSGLWVLFLGPIQDAGADFYREHCTPAMPHFLQRAQSGTHDGLVLFLLTTGGV